LEILLGLRKALRNTGLCLPLRLEKAEASGKVTLLAGERRLRASIIAGKTTIPYRFYEELTEQEQFEIELEENIQRKEMHWSEQIEVRRKIEEIMKRNGVAIDPNDPLSARREATVIDMANKTGESAGSFSRQVVLAKKMKENPALLAKFAHLPINAAIRAIDQYEEVQRVTRLEQSGQLTFRSSIQAGDARVLIVGVPNESIDLVVSDPPFGIAELSDNEGKPRGDSQSYLGLLKPNDNLNLDGVRQLIKDIGPHIFRVLKPGAFFYFFHAADIYEALRKELESHGLYVDPKPIIWNKLRPTTGFTGYNYPSSYEPILFGYKPPASRRLGAAIRDIIDCPPVPVKDRFHPFEKPVDLLRKLIENSTIIGQKVLDPFAGSGSTVVAAELCGREGIGFEYDSRALCEGSD
jgi:DNA modification methylase/ParB-like chromosome segregation protein Spo0J